MDEVKWEENERRLGGMMSGRQQEVWGVLDVSVSLPHTHTHTYTLELFIVGG